MRKIIDIFGILLPALIILLGIIRVFVKKTKGVNGLTMILAILLLLSGLVRYFIFPQGGSSTSDGPKLLPLTVSKHSTAFNQSIENVLANYFILKAGFVKNDTALINKSANAVSMALDSFKIADLKVDTLIYETALQPYGNALSEIKSILADPLINEKRNSFNILSNELFSLINTVRYDLAKLYWLECINAFGEEKPGNWIGLQEKDENPYGQNECVETKATIDHVPADTTKTTNADSIINK